MTFFIIFAHRIKHENKCYLTASTCFENSFTESPQQIERIADYNFANDTTNQVHCSRTKTIHEIFNFKPQLINGEIYTIPSHICF